MAPNENQWSCEQVEGRLSDYLDRLLEAGERIGFEAHVAACARCAPLVERVADVVAGMHRLEPLEAPPQLQYKILDQTLGPRAAKKGLRAWLGWLRPVMQPRFAYGAAMAVVTLAVVVQALGIQWRRPTLAHLSPVNIYRAADRGAHLIYARGARFVTDLRVVYEIQSLLRPDAEPQAAPESQPSPGKSPGQSIGPPPKSPRELNRANDKSRNPTMLACALGAAPTGSAQ